MKKLIMCKGLPASGKTTWAKEIIASSPTNSIKRVNKDDLRGMMDGNKYSKGNESFILSVRDSFVTQALDSGKNVIVDDTNFHPKHELKLREIAKDCRAEFSIQDFTDVTLATCLIRNQKRTGTPAFVPENVIRSMAREYITPTKPKTNIIPHVDGLPSCIICDLDGTLAIHTDRSPYEGEKCASDKVNMQVHTLINRYPIDKIIFMSGRAKDDRVENETKKWLANECGFNIDLSTEFYDLHLREAGDMRKDYVVKKELYEKHIKGKYNVEFCLDDRNQVVNLWRELGLQCFQVAEGNF